MITNKKGEWLEIIAPNEWVDSTIEAILKDILQIPKGLLHQFRMNQSVLINHKPIPWHKKLCKGDKVMIHLFIKEPFGVVPEYGELSILFEDEHLLIANKQAGIETHPNKKEQQGTLANFVAQHFLMNETECKVRHIHRLDKGTSGAIIFAKHPLIASQLDRMLERREIKRTYIALVEGIIQQKNGFINEPIGKDRHHPTRRRVSNNGQSALTYFKVIDVHQKLNVSMVMLQLQTGRTHQIRVHMSHMGFPIVGDTLYGGKDHLLKRPALHAAHISFIHPITKEEIKCFAPNKDLFNIFSKPNLKEIIGQAYLY